MNFICEEDPNVEDLFYETEASWYGGTLDESDEAPTGDSASIVSQLQCQEAEARKSDLQLACRLDQLANSLRAGTPPNFNDEFASHSPGQSLNEFLCTLEKRLLEKTQSQEETCREPICSDRVTSTPKSRSPSPRARRKRSPARRINFADSTSRTGPPPTSAMRSCLPQSTMRSCLPQSTMRSCPEPPTSPDWKAMLNDSNEIVCYPSERMSMYGLTAGDIWKQRSQAAAAPSPCKCASPPRTPVRQVQAIPVRCIPSPKFEIEESLLSPSDIYKLEYCGCTVEDILKKKAKKRAQTFLDSSSCDDTPNWHHRKKDDSPFFRSSKRHSHSRKASPSSRKCLDFDTTPDFSQSDLMASCLKGTEDTQTSKGVGSMTCDDWTSKSRSNSSMCCCDGLAQRVAAWTESQFGGHNDKAVNAATSCRTLIDKKPMLKRKPNIGAKKFRETSYKTFVSGISPCRSSPESSSRRAVDCLECSRPEVVTLIRHQHNCPRTPGSRPRGIQRKGTPMKCHLVTPPLSYTNMDEFEF